MRNTKIATTHPFRKVLIIVGVLLMLVGAYTVTAYAIKLWPFNTASEQSSQSAGDTNNGNQQQSTNGKTGTDGATVPGTTNTAKDTPVDSGAQQSGGTVSIPFAQQNGDILRITTLITGVESTGTCTLTLTKESSTVTLPVVGIQAGPSSSTCQGFNVSISQQQLTAGVWNISIDVDSNSTKASATTKVTIQ